MPLALSIVTLVLAAAAVVLLLLARRRNDSVDLQPLLTRLDVLEKSGERTERAMTDEIARNRDEAATQSRALREETAASIQAFNDSVLQQIARFAALEKGQLDAFALQQQAQLEAFSQRISSLTDSNTRKADELKAAVEGKLAQLQADNTAKLEEMRRTVDEKLQGTLEKRLGESFKLVSDRLELVHKGLGEMQSLASGVGDLKKVLTNVKTRGTWGEMQLGNLLEQILTPEQYAQNVATKEGSNDRVEFAIRLPGRDEVSGKVVWLPIDAKFPKEDYERLVLALEAGDLPAADEASRQLEVRLKAEARSIAEKYLDPPNTTDFGILFLPSESLYAEVLRKPGLVETLQREHRVNVAGPTTLAALLNSLQMGFRTLAIEKRSSEVWTVLGAVKTEFGKFGEVMERVQKKLQEAGNVIEDASKRTRAMERKLRDVQQLPEPQARALLGESAPGNGDAESV